MKITIGVNTVMKSMKNDPQHWPEINNLILEHLLLGHFLLFIIFKYVL